MNELVIIVKKRIETLEEQLNNLKNSLNTIQSECNHKHLNGDNAIEYVGDDGKGRVFYKCKVCGKEIEKQE